MNSSNANPALPAWVFIATDLALLGIASAIALLSPYPLSTSTTLLIVALVALGAVAGLLPLIARYERLKNEALDERQRSLEALARTVSSSAEQISIAANGLHQVTEVAHKNLRAAEQLPHKLQEKIAEFQAQLSATSETGNEELERELLALRTTESERLESVSQRIAKSAAEWTKLEAATSQHLAAANEALSKLALGTANAIGKAQAAAEQALSQARVEAARTLGESSGNATRQIEQAKSAALSELEARLAAATATLVARVTAALKTSGLTSTSEPVAPPDSDAASTSVPAAPPNQIVDASSGTEIPRDSGAPSADQSSQASRKPRKPRREETAAETAEPAHPSAAQPEPDSVAERPGAATRNSPPPFDEPLPVPADKIPEVTPVDPNTAEPFAGHITKSANGSASPVESITPPAPSAAASPPSAPLPAAIPPESGKPPRKRAGKKAEFDDEPALGLELDDSAAGFNSGSTERVLSSDGATRLLVTAYIGIGNRLFIRGDGPGLSWEKGVPLQFVSIGKWRWETSDASAPVRFKLYKNDDVECPALGNQTLDPGHQQEVTAAF